MLIKSMLSIRALAALVAAASLAACANPYGSQQNAEHHPGQSATSQAQGGMMGAGMAGSSGGCRMMGGATPGNPAGCGMMGSSHAAGAGGMQQMSRDEMCAMYRSMRDAPNEQARQAMMDRHMQGMPPEMRQRNMEMMRQQCQ